MNKGTGNDESKILLRRGLATRLDLFLADTERTQTSEIYPNIACLLNEGKFDRIPLVIFLMTFVSIHAGVARKKSTVGIC